MQNSILPKIPSKQIEELLQSKELEDFDLIKRIEGLLSRKRKYIFKMPNPGGPVVLMLSGGLDTVIVCDILMRKYKLNVYPIFLRRGHRRIKNEERSVDYFSKLYSQIFPNLYHLPKKMNAFIPPIEIRWPITEVSNKLVKHGSKQWRGIPMYSALLVSYSVQYAYYLEITQNISIRNIFCGFVPSDGEPMAYETLTALRVIMLTSCVLTNDYSWQVSSLPLEKELNFFWDKDILIKWANKNGLPINKTWSCYWGGIYHCGNCIGCGTRKEAFKKSGIHDPTIYWNETPMGRISNKIKSF
jgi:7-cyano-7-deazaguanine synthase in queuosine biosynthesis